MIDTVDIVQIFERFDDFHVLLKLFIGNFNGSLSHISQIEFDFLFINTHRLESLNHHGSFLLIRQDLGRSPFFFDHLIVFAANLDSSLQQCFFVNLNPYFYFNHSLSVVHENDRALFSNFTISLVHGGLHISSGSVVVVGQNGNHHGGSTKPISFESLFLEITSISVSSLFDGSVDVVDRDRVCFGLFNQIGQHAVGVGIWGSTLFDSHDNFLAIKSIRFGFFGICLGFGTCSHCRGAAHKQGEIEGFFFSRLLIEQGSPCGWDNAHEGGSLAQQANCEDCRDF